MPATSEQLDSLLNCMCPGNVSEDLFRWGVLGYLSAIAASTASFAPVGPITEMLTQTTVNVTNASSEVVATEATRRGGFIRNLDDDEDIFVFLGAGPATVGTGLGQVVPHEVYKLPENYTGPVQAIRGSVGTAIVEVVTW